MTNQVLPQSMTGICIVPTRVSTPFRALNDARRALFYRGMQLTLGALLLGSAGCHEAAPDKVLVVYAAGPRELAESMCKDFEKQSGVTTRLFSATTGEIMAKLKAEEFQPQADVVVLAGQTAAQVLKEEDSLARLPKGDYLKLNPQWNDPEGYYAATGACALGLAVRKDHDRNALDWQEVFDGAISGNAMMPSPSQSGSSAEFVVSFHLDSPDKFWNGMRKIKSRGLQVSGPNNQALTSLILGAHEAVLGAADYLVFRQIEKGEPLAMIFPEPGCPLSLRPIGILRTSRHQQEAEQFVQFCFSRPTQERIAAEHLLPADPHVALSAVRQAGPTLHPLLVDVVEAKQAQHAALRKFRFEIEKGLGGVAE